MTTSPPSEPILSRSGCDGLVVSFAPAFEPAANRAALALRAAIAAQNWPGVTECAASLVSASLRFDPLTTDAAALETRLRALMSSRDWRRAAPDRPARRVTLPVCFDPALAPDAARAAAAMDMRPAQMIEALAAAPLRVLTIGFAPGFPYIGELPPAFDLPRQRQLTPRVPAGALGLAIRQLVLFPAPTQTGWRQIGQSAARLFDPTAARPFLLNAGDEIRLIPVPAEVLGTAEGQPSIEEPPA